MDDLHARVTVYQSLPQVVPASPPLNGLGGQRAEGHKVVSILARKGHAISPAARRRIAAAQKARWAKWRKAQKKA
jgi:hypothetical protein